MTEYNVGRNPSDAQDRIVISGDNTVSSNHCRLTSMPDGSYRLEDTASTNGTYIMSSEGWRRTNVATVYAEDQIKLGKYVTTIGRLIAAADRKPRTKATRNPETGEIEQRS